MKKIMYFGCIMLFAITAINFNSSNAKLSNQDLNLSEIISISIANAESEDDGLRWRVYSGAVITVNNEEKIYGENGEAIGFVQKVTTEHPYREYFGFGSEKTDPSETTIQSTNVYY